LWTQSCGEIDKLAETAEAQEGGGKMRRGRPRLPWEDCKKRDQKPKRWERNGEWEQKKELETAARGCNGR